MPGGENRLYDEIGENIFEWELFEHYLETRGELSTNFGSNFNTCM